MKMVLMSMLQNSSGDTDTESKLMDTVGVRGRRGGGRYGESNMKT